MDNVLRPAWEITVELWHDFDLATKTGSLRSGEHSITALQARISESSVLHYRVVTQQDVREYSYRGAFLVEWKE